MNHLFSWLFAIEIITVSLCVRSASSLLIPARHSRLSWKLMSSLSDENPSKRTKTSRSQFSSLSKVTTIVADTGDIGAIKKYCPTDATTNPSLVYKAALMPEYSHLVDAAVSKKKKNKKKIVPSSLLVLPRSFLLHVSGVVHPSLTNRLPVGQVCR